MEIISLLLLHLLCIAAQEDYWDDFSEFEGEVLEDQLDPKPMLLPNLTIRDDAFDDMDSEFEVLEDQLDPEPRPQLPQEETFINLSPAQLASKLLKLESEFSNLKEENLRISAEVTNLKEQNLNMKTKGFRTCQELKTNSDIKTSGEYFLDPAQSGSPVKVFCDMEKEQTVISHDSEAMTPIEYCNGDGCFVMNVTYNIPDKQIEALIENSDTCYQNIEFGCKMAPLKNRMFGNFYGWWVGRDGGEKYYFDGGDEDNQVCGCAATSSCLQSRFNSTCNCDGNLLPLWTKDQGTLTNKASLPVKAFVYGSFMSNMQEANITVSKLRCSGTVTKSQDSVSSCAELKKSGVSVDGFYITKETVEADIEASYCQMSQNGYTEEDLRTLSLPLHKTIALNVRLTSGANMGRGEGQSCQRNYYNLYKSGTLSHVDRPEFERVAVKEHLDLDTATFTFQKTGMYMISHNNNGDAGSCRIKFKLNSEWIHHCDKNCVQFFERGDTLEIWQYSRLTRFHLVIKEF